MSWKQLWAAASAIAFDLDASGCGPGRGVVIFCDDEVNFVVSLVAVWMTGAVAIPATGGLNASLLERNQHIFRCAEPDFVLHDLSRSRFNTIADLCEGAVTLTVTSELGVSSPELWEFGFQAALLQFTSGTTSNPKPVLLSADNLASGCQAIENAFGLDEESIGLHWLPLYHDMGLIGSVVEPIYTGCASVILRPSIFIQRPLYWFQLASELRATITAAPNFAYEILCTAAAETNLDQIDLSNLRTVIFGGEPVQKATVERLKKTFAPARLSPASIAPCYGMAEATLLVSSGQTSTAPTYRLVNETEHTCLGTVVPQISATVCDPVDGSRIRAGEVGEIFLEGLSVGTVVQPGESWREVQPRNSVKTGDWGCVADGELYIVGRDAGRLILRGKNVHAEDVEKTVSASQRVGILNATTAIAINTSGTQTLCLICELQNRTADFDIRAANSALMSVLGVKPSRVIIVRRGSLPRTSSGKIRRAMVQEMYHSNSLKIVREVTP